MNNLQNSILNKIKAGEVSMVPKWHFMLRAGLLLSGVILATLLSVYLLSFILFFLRQSGLMFAPGFGFHGISFFVMASPWLLISVTIVFLILLYFLVKQYAFSFKRPLLYSMIGVVVLSLLGAWLIGQTQTHQRLGQFMGQHHVPVFTPLYRDVLDRRPEGLMVGTITELTETGFYIETERDGLISITTSTDTRMRPGTELVAGKMVMVFGKRNGDRITAFGIRPYDRERRSLLDSQPRKRSEMPPEHPKGDSHHPADINLIPELAQ